MRRCLLALAFFCSTASAQEVLFICTAQLPCPGFPLGSVQAGIDQNGWRHFKLTLTQNVSQFSFQGTPPPAQAAVTVIFTQDAIGGRTVTFASNIGNPCMITTAANSTSLCQFEFDGTTATWSGVSAGLPTGAIGSVLVSQGVGIPTAFQSKSYIDVRDYGAKCDNSTNDTTSVNNALAAAVAIGNSFGTAEVVFPTGICLGNFSIVQGKGLRIHGTGELSTRLRGLGSTAALQINGLWYSSFSDMSFDIQNHSAAGAVLEIDGNYDGIHTQSIQFLTFNNVLVAGQGASDGILSNYTVAVCRQSNGACQGSNLNFQNVALSGASNSVYYQNGFNALSNVFIGGDIQNYTKDGARSDNGDVGFYSTTFESTVGYDQVNNGGCDIRDNAAFYAMPIYDVRSESVSLLCGTGTADVRGLNNGNSSGLVVGQHNAVVWTATTAFTVGQVIAVSPTQWQVGQTNYGPLAGFRYYKVTTGGTSGGTQPAWPYTGTITDGSVVWTPQETFARINLPLSQCSYVPHGFMVNATGSFVCRGPHDLNTSENRNSQFNPLVTSNTMVDPSDEYLLVDASGGSLNLTIGGGFLDNTDQPQEGHLLYIRRIDAADTTSGALNTVTITGNAAIFDGKSFAFEGNTLLPPDSFIVLEYTKQCNNCSAASGWIQVGGTFFARGFNGYNSTSSAGTVKVNAKTGFITTESLTTAAGGDFVLTFNNNRISRDSIVDLNVMNGTNTGGLAMITTVNTNTAGQAIIDIHNIGATPFNGTLTLKFMVI